jgi:thymidine phosphorylase
MEVFCDVAIPIPKLKKILKKVGGFMVWGGAEEINLAPADDKIIKIEHPLEIDAEGQMLASIMSKKKSVCATHLLIEIPTGKGAKVGDRKEAVHLTRHFERLGEELGIEINVMVTDGSHPIGKGIGPVLEAKDCLYVLKNDKRGAQDLKQKSLEMAAILLEFVGAVKPTKGMEKAKKLLESGKAYEAMVKIIKAQGGKEINPDKLKPEKFSFNYNAPKKGVLKCLDNIAIAKTARLAGAPLDKGAGIFLHHNCGDRVKKGEKILTVYARSRQKLEFAKETLKQYDGIVIQ